MHAHKVELFAFIYFCNKHRFLLFGWKFKWFTDNISLLSVDSMKCPRNISNRWIDTLANFTFEVKHRKGKDNSDVDYLIREGATQEPDVEEEDENFDQEDNPILIH